MRQVGSLPTQAEAIKFAAFLTTEGVVAHTEEDGERWIIWVHDETQVAQAREAYTEFRQDPSASTYRGVEEKAEEILREKRRKQEEAGKNVIEMRGRWKRGGSQRQPLITTLIVISVIVFLASNFGNDTMGIPSRMLKFTDPQRYLPGSEVSDSIAFRTIDIRQGEVWRIITPIFFHFSILHIAMNMIVLYQFGNPVEQRRGTWNFGWMVLTIAATSNLAQCLVPYEWGGGVFVGGMSGVIFGILGYSWMKTRYQPELGIFVPQGTVYFFLGFMFFCMSPLADFLSFRVANWAHGVGLLTGMAIGVAPVWFRAVSGRS